MVSSSGQERPGREQVAALAERVAREWQDDPNVVHVDLCLKVTGGVVQPQVRALGFYVRHKLATDVVEQRGWRLVPAEVEGVLTDVIDTHQPAHGSVDEKDTRSQLFDTLVGGIAIGNAQINAYGTLGMTLLAADDGRLVGLTNEHVLVFDVDGHVGDDVVQPRFYLNSEVSLDAADCCPGGQLRYRGVDNPIVDAAAAVFAAAAIAAVASDDIDPHRRGQDATPVDPGEHTQREVVRMEVGYPEIPLPGTPFTAKVHWRYERHTDTRVLTHEVEEEKQNEHHTSLQLLATDRREYPRGARVELYAALAPDAYSGRCNYFVTAAVLSPNGRQALKVVLRPWKVERRDSHPMAQHLANRAESSSSDNHYCLYHGWLALPPDAQLGKWRTYLYAQTLNDVPAGTKPEDAARTIGGLPVTANLLPGGRTSHILYGERCEIRQRTYGSFIVADPEPPPIIR
jgi:hypothetical protein